MRAEALEKGEGGREGKGWGRGGWKRKVSGGG